MPTARWPSPTAATARPSLPPAGVVYTPRHGEGLEPRLTWRYRARAIATDTTTHSLAAVAPVVSAIGDHVVDFVRPGLIERYEGERAGVEQIFVLPERPAGRGDVRIVGDVGFAGSIRAKDGGLEFDAGNGLPAFTYAKPIAFDARRTPVPVRVEVAGAALSLVIDGVALDRVQWPVTIDPLFGVTVVEPLFAGFGAGVRLQRPPRRVPRRLLRLGLGDQHVRAGAALPRVRRCRGSIVCHRDH